MDFRPATFTRLCVAFSEHANTKIQAARCYRAASCVVIVVEDSAPPILAQDSLEPPPPTSDPSPHTQRPDPHPPKQTQPPQTPPPKTRHGMTQSRDGEHARSSRRVSKHLISIVPVTLGDSGSVPFRLKGTHYFCLGYCRFWHSLMAPPHGMTSTGFGRLPPSRNWK